MISIESKCSCAKMYVNSLPSTLKAYVGLDVEKRLERNMYRTKLLN